MFNENTTDDVRLSEMVDQLWQTRNVGDVEIRYYTGPIEELRGGVNWKKNS